MILLLGGTTEARRLAERLVNAGADVVTSLAGDVDRPRIPSGRVRIGGFGGVAGLADYLRAEQVSAVVDATHPFAAGITANAAAACLQQGIPLLRLSRPGWSGRPDAANWHWVDSPDAAAQCAGALGSRIFVSTGRQTVPAFLGLADRYVLVRTVDAPPVAVPPSWELILARGPFDPTSELELLSGRRIEVLVTKDSGGDSTAAKLDAAAALGVAVVVIRRPPEPDGVPVVGNVADALAALPRLTGRFSAPEPG